MKATTHVKVYLTSEQRRWIETRAKQEKTTLSRGLVSLIEEHMEEKSTETLLKKVLESISKLEAQQATCRSEVLQNFDESIVYLKEMFRESAANLYRLEAIVEDMDDSISVRMKMNEHVRRKEREVQEAIASTRAGVTRG